MKEWGITNLDYYNSDAHSVNIKFINDHLNIISPMASAAIDGLHRLNRLGDDIQDCDEFRTLKTRINKIMNTFTQSIQKQRTLEIVAQSKQITC